MSPPHDAKPRATVIAPSPASPSPPPPAPGAEALGPNGETFACPKCHALGCPARGGSQMRKRGRVRYRECSGCGHVFSTLLPHGGALEEVTG